MIAVWISPHTLSGASSSLAFLIGQTSGERQQHSKQHKHPKNHLSFFFGASFGFCRAITFSFLKRDFGFVAAELTGLLAEAVYLDAPVVKNFSTWVRVTSPFSSMMKNQSNSGISFIGIVLT
jgi:hypothetical protein